VDPAVMFQVTNSLLHTVIYTVRLYYVFVSRCPTICTLQIWSDSDRASSL